MKNKLKQLIENNRGRNVKRLKITKEQKEFLLVCRDSDNPVSFLRMAEIWENEMKWGAMSGEWLRQIYVRAKQGKL